MKLTKAQRKILSNIIYRYLNGVDHDNYNNRVILKLKQENLIDSLYIPTLLGSNIYINNLTKGTILANKDGVKIELYKNFKENHIWEFIYFMTEGKCGGGDIAYNEIIRDYYIV